MIMCRCTTDPYENMKSHSGRSDGEPYVLRQKYLTNLLKGEKEMVLNLGQV